VKPDVLSDGEIARALHSTPKTKLKFESVLTSQDEAAFRDEMKLELRAIAQAQRDADYEHEQNTIRGIFEETKGLFETIEAMYPELQQVYWESKGWQSLKGEYLKEAA